MKKKIYHELQGPTHVKRASTEKLKEIFLKYASLQENGEYFMTSEDFSKKYLGVFEGNNVNKVSRTLISSSKKKKSSTNWVFKLSLRCDDKN